MLQGLKWRGYQKIGTYTWWLLYLEREMGQKLNPDEWSDTLTELRQDKVEKYILAIRRIIQKSKGVSCGTDITKAIS